MHSVPENVLADLHLSMRPGLRKDGAVLNGLIRGILESYGLSPDREGMDADLDDVETFYHARGGLFIVLEDFNGAVVGSCGVLPLSHERCELRKLYLAHPFRGHSLGKLLLRCAMDWARNRGFQEMELHTAASLKEAVGLYRRFGFERSGFKGATDRCELHFRCKLAAPVSEW